MYSDSNKNQLIECIKTLSSEAIHMLLTLALRMIDVENITITICPYCGSEEIVRNGKKCGKQRFLCKSCKRTLLPLRTRSCQCHTPRLPYGGRLYLTPFRGMRLITPQNVSDFLIPVYSACAINFCLHSRI